MPHTRTDIDLDNEVLRVLSGAHYKVLRYLCNRADSRGVCFPTNETIAAGVNHDPRHTARLLPELVDMGLVGYLRRDEYDGFTGRKIPNVYIVNPKYISLSEANQAEAEALWKAARPYDSGVTLTNNNQLQRTNSINQHQNPTPQGPMPGDQQQQPPASAPLNEKTETPELSDDPTATRETDETQDGSDSTARSAQRSLPLPGVPPAVMFRNPVPMDEPLTDMQEELAQKIRRLGVPLKMARGFVLEYGAVQCEDALMQTLAADRSIEDGVRNFAGFFRAILQRKLTDRQSFSAHQTDDDNDQEAQY